MKLIALTMTLFFGASSASVLAADNVTYYKGPGTAIIGLKPQSFMIMTKITSHATGVDHEIIRYIPKDMSGVKMSLVLKKVKQNWVVETDTNFSPDSTFKAQIKGAAANPEVITAIGPAKDGRILNMKMETNPSLMRTEVTVKDAAGKTYAKIITNQDAIDEMTFEKMKNSVKFRSKQ